MRTCSGLFCLLTLMVGSSCTAPSRQSPVPAPPSAAAPTTAPALTSTDPNLTLQLADVDSVRAVFTPSPPAIAVTISGLLNDGATRIHEVRQQASPSGVVLTVITARPKNAMATLALIPFERNVTIDVSSRPPGPLTILANGKSASVVIP